MILFMAAAIAAADPPIAPRPVVPVAAYRAETPRPAIDLAGAATPRASTYAQANALRAAGVARTSVDHRFAGDDVVGSFGFLCGLQPSRDGGGGAAAYGVDPNGRFLGAKLRFTFR
ncbi:MAG TPA: hypothetical protein VFW47_01030 [Phenylobacterium sp.]|nr:hypothetical protein [Phenylobacterium sp.]